MRSALRDRDEECGDESDSITDKQRQLVLGIEYLASQPQSYGVGNELKDIPLVQAILVPF